METVPLLLVLDTNVWLDWLIFDNPGVARVRQAVSTGRAEVCIDQACLAELARVLAYPLTGAPLAAEAQSWHLARAEKICRVLDRAALAASPEHALPRCRDPDDQKFLELARDCRADALLTRDRALLELASGKRRPLPFRILAPDELAV